MKRILGCSIGNCVHVAGVIHFLDLAENEGYEPTFLGPAVPAEKLFQAVNQLRPDVVTIGYRLTPQNVIPLLDQVNSFRKSLDFPVRWVFGGTKPVAEIAREYDFFSFVSDGTDDINDSIHFLRGNAHSSDGERQYANTLTERVNQAYPYPLLRHHFGLPSYEETLSGVRQLAESKVLDVISLGPDQNAQQCFFKPAKMSRENDGAGGVPLRSREDFIRLKQASETGNHPLMRCYSGTEDVFDFAKLLVDTIDNAWTAIPLCWYNELDKRGTRALETSIPEAQHLIRWHALRGIPVEINEPHHWGLREAHDVLPVAMAYVSAYNAKKLGVSHYVPQYMFNNPSGLSFPMDMARNLAMAEIVSSLEDESFHVYRETRAGLPMFSADEAVAKGQLAASTFMQMVLKPHIIHVVGYCEANHAACAQDVIESCKIVKGVIRHSLNQSFSIENDPAIEMRKQELLSEAWKLLSFIRNEYSEFADPLANAFVLSDCIKKGYLDAVHILKGDKFKGDLTTKFVDGKCLAYDRETGNLLSEEERLARLKHRAEQNGSASVNEQIDEKRRTYALKGVV